MKKLCGVLALCFWATLLTPISSLADTVSDEIEKEISKHEEANLDDRANLDTSIIRSSDLIYTHSDSRVAISKNPDEPIQMSTEDSSISIWLPSRHYAEDAISVSDGTVAFDNKNSSYTVPVIHKDGSLQINTLIQNASAPKEYEYVLKMPPGVSTRLGLDGSIFFETRDHKILGGVPKPWARDSEGKWINTTYELTNSGFKQIVDFEDASTFPIVADPWFGFDTIDQAYWSYLWEWSPTLVVIPTWWGRNSDAQAADDVWAEVKSKTLAYRSRLGSPTMRVQFDCHWYFVRLRSPNKPSCNLDWKLPYTSLANSLKYGCNYYPGATPTSIFN